jgi:hypothetical protein
MPLQIFCDEFGNTGARLLPTDQPVLVYAFVIIEPAALTTAGERISLTLQEGAAGRSELKSSRLMKSLRGRSLFGEIGHHVSEHLMRTQFAIDGGNVVRGEIVDVEDVAETWVLEVQVLGDIR